MINNDNKKKNKTKQESNRYYQHKTLKLCVRSAYTHTHTQKHERERLFLTLNTPKLDVTTRIEEKKEQKKNPATHQNNGISFTIKMVKRGQSSSTDISKKEKHKSKTAQRTYTRT